MRHVNVLVIGSGIMGIGIAQACAQGGNKVVVNDLNDDILAKAKENIERQIEMMLKNDLYDKAKADATRANISYNAKLEDCAGDMDVVFEVIPEKLELKNDLFDRLEKLCPAKTIFATNTSGISINILAEGVKRKDKLVGTHFFNPALLIPLVEIICGEKTSDETVTTIMDMLSKSGKKPVKVAKDIPGFIGNRLQHALAREAMSLVQKGVATPEGIDEVVKSSIALRMLFTGPMEQRDFNGLDTHLSIASYLYKDLEDSHEPLQILKDKVAEGKWGLKTGEGFYDWKDKSVDNVKANTNQELIDVIKFVNSKNKK